MQALQGMRLSPMRAGEILMNSKVRYVRISLTSECRLRCGYCRATDEKVKKARETASDLLGFDEIYRLIRVLRNIGVEKFRFTGGEPFVRKRVFDFLDGLNLKSYFITSSLYINPEKIKRINALNLSGLSGVNVSLDTLDKDKYRRLTGGNLELVKNNLKNLRVKILKLNTILLKDFNIDEAETIIEFARSIGAIPRFIEKMDLIPDNFPRGSIKKVRRRLINSGMIAPSGRYIGNSVSRYYKLKGGGEVGFITPISEPFCGRCDKVRITSDGKLKLCLFEDGGIDLKSLLQTAGAGRAGEKELEKELLKIFSHKKQERITGTRNVDMVSIGG